MQTVWDTLCSLPPSRRVTALLEKGLFLTNVAEGRVQERRARREAVRDFQGLVLDLEHWLLEAQGRLGAVIRLSRIEAVRDSSKVVEVRLDFKISIISNPLFIFSCFPVPVVRFTIERGGRDEAAGCFRLLRVLLGRGRGGISNPYSARGRARGHGRRARGRREWQEESHHGMN